MQPLPLPLLSCRLRRMTCRTGGRTSSDIYACIFSEEGPRPQHQGQERHQRRLRDHRAREGEVPDVRQGEGHRERRVVRAMRTVSMQKDGQSIAFVHRRLIHKLT